MFLTMPISQCIATEQWTKDVFAVSCETWNWNDAFCGIESKAPAAMDCVKKQISIWVTGVLTFITPRIPCYKH
jgi:hypothetical protein